MGDDPIFHLSNQLIGEVELWILLFWLIYIDSVLMLGFGCTSWSLLYSTSIWCIINWFLWYCDFILILHPYEWVPGILSHILIFILCRCIQVWASSWFHWLSRGTWSIIIFYLLSLSYSILYVVISFLLLEYPYWCTWLTMSLFNTTSSIWFLLCPKASKRI